MFTQLHRLHYLVGGIPTPLKNMKVNGKDDIPYMKWKIKAMFETTNQVISHDIPMIFTISWVNSSDFHPLQNQIMLLLKEYPFSQLTLENLSHLVSEMAQESFRTSWATLFFVAVFHMNWSNKWSNQFLRFLSQVM